MNPPSSNRYKHHRLPVETNSRAVWLYFRFCLSDCDVEALQRRTPEHAFREQGSKGAYHSCNGQG